MSTSEITSTTENQVAVVADAPETTTTAVAVQPAESEAAAGVVVDIQSIKNEIRKQVEFYFSVDNLPRDKFLKGKVTSDPEGYVDIALICSFAKMAKFVAYPEAIIEALRSSTVLEVNAEGTRVKLQQPIELTFDEDSLFKRQVLLRFIATNVIDDALRTELSEFVVEHLQQIPDLNPSYEVDSLLTRIDFFKVYKHGTPAERAKTDAQPFEKVMVTLSFKDEDTANKFHHRFEELPCDFKGQLLKVTKRYKLQKMSTKIDIINDCALDNMLKITGYPDGANLSDLTEVITRITPNLVIHHAPKSRFCPEPYSVVLLEQHGRVEQARDAFNADESAVIRVLVPSIAPAAQQAIEATTPEANSTEQKAIESAAPEADSTEQKAIEGAAPEAASIEQGSAETLALVEQAAPVQESTGLEVAAPPTEEEYRLQASMFTQAEFIKAKDGLRIAVKRSMNEPNIHRNSKQKKFNHNKRQKK